MLTSWGRFADCSMGPVFIDELSYAYLGYLKGFINRAAVDHNTHLLSIKIGREEGGSIFEYYFVGDGEPVARITISRSGDLWGIRGDWLR